MQLAVSREVDKMRRMTVKELKERYREVFGEESRSGNKDFLWKRIAWRMQALAEGGLSERARHRAEEIANEADLRIRPPAGAFKPTADSSSKTTASYSYQSDQEQRLPMPGAILIRHYKGIVIRVLVMDKGFEYNGEVYRSLTAITRKVTGTRWNGYHFFGINKGRAEA